MGNMPLTTNFNASQTFQNYVVAPFNRFAFAAAQDVCQDGGPRFNPLFIQGPPGLGKTHLLQAIGNARLANNGDTAAYLNCRHFPGYETSVTMGSSELIFQSLDDVTIILVDDVHLVPEEAGLQQHLREAFDLCYDSDKQMVFAASHLPHQIPDLPTGLRSRLGWGLIARIREPDFNDWYQVMQTFLGRTEMPLSTGVCQYLAEQGPLNFHQIREYVERLQEIVEREGHPPDLRERPSTSHGDFAPDLQRLSIQAIQKEICTAYGVSPEVLAGKTKSRHSVIARQVGMYLSRKLTGSTYAVIGEAFGGRDHSTVIYACRKVRAEMRRTRQFADRLVEIEKNLLEVYEK
jgi:chromosomal replication initiator protein